jgi:hypothetical protein
VVVAGALLTSGRRAEASEYVSPAFDPASFVGAVDNSYSALVPGTTFTYEGKTDGEPTSNGVTVTYDTKLILAATCTVRRAFGDPGNVVVAL